MSSSIPIVIVSDPLGLYVCGTPFPRQQFAITLWLACWPIGLVVRDTFDDRRYDVIQYEAVKSDGTRYQHQRLVAIGNDVELYAAGNGNLKRVVVNDG